MFVKVENSSYIKDESTGVFINNNDDEYRKILARRDQARKDKEVCSKIKNLEHEILAIKDMLIQIINKE